MLAKAGVKAITIIHWKTSTTVHANSSTQLFSEATGKGELFGHTGPLTTKNTVIQPALKREPVGVL